MRDEAAPQHSQTALEAVFTWLEGRQIHRHLRPTHQHRAHPLLREHHFVRAMRAVVAREQDADRGVRRYDQRLRFERRAHGNTYNARGPGLSVAERAIGGRCSF